jgi:hypothetical protein
MELTLCYLLYVLAWLWLDFDFLYVWLIKLVGIADDNRYYNIFVQTFRYLNDASILTPENCQVLQTVGYIYAVNIADALVTLHRAGILEQYSDALIQNVMYGEDIANGFVALHRAGILEQYSDALIQNVMYGEDIADGFVALHRAGILEQYSNLLIQSPQNARNIATSLVALYGYGILEQYSDALIQNAEHAGGIVVGLVTLRKAGILELYSDALIQNAEHAINIAEGLKTLHEAGILEQYSNLLIQNPQNAKNIAMRLITLHRARILEQYSNVLIQNVEDANDIVIRLIALYEIGILERYSNFLIQNPQNAKNIAAGLVALHRARILEQYFDTLIQNAEHAETIAMKLIELHKAESLEQYSNLLIQNPQNAESIGRAINLLKVFIAPQLLTPVDVEAIINNAPYIENIVNLLSILWEEKGIFYSAGVKEQIRKKRIDNFEEFISDILKKLSQGIKILIKKPQCIGDIVKLIGIIREHFFQHNTYRILSGDDDDCYKYILNLECLIRNGQYARFILADVNTFLESLNDSSANKKELGIVKYGELQRSAIVKIKKKCAYSFFAAFLPRTGAASNLNKLPQNLGKPIVEVGIFGY